jgi:four helix bundle protein
VQDFRNIEAWRLSRPFVVAIYRTTRRWPRDELFGLTGQVRRSASAVGAAIAEAFGRSTRADTARVLQNAVSEGNETLHHLMTALDPGYLEQAEFDSLVEQLAPIRQKTFNLLMRIRR